MTTPLSSDTGDADELRGRIRSLIRTARQEHGLTQAELGKRVGASRFIINRVEAGVTDVTPPLAEQLEQALGLAELRPLVAQRDRHTVMTLGRDGVVARMLQHSQVYRFRVVLTDNLDLYPMLYAWSGGDSKLQADDIEIVVPTWQREHELFGPDSGLRRAIDYQVKRILDLRRSDNYAADSLRLYESDGVTSAIAIAIRGDRAEAVMWPPIAVSGKWSPAEAAALPVGLTADQHIVARMNAHVDALIAGREPLRSNEALCRITTAGKKKTMTFTRYFTVGEEQEEEVDDSEGIAVALVLVLARCPRRGYGVGRRVVTYMRASSRQDHLHKRSLFSNTVEHTDIRRAQADEAGQPTNERFSTQGALAAAIEIDDFLQSKEKVIPELAFRIAAARELAMFGLDVDLDRLESVPLPPELWLVEKENTDERRRASIAPRLFVLELKTQPTPELVTLQANTHVEEVGVSDVLEDPDLNSFLTKARDAGFLAELLTSRGILDR